MEKNRVIVFLDFVEKCSTATSENAAKTVIATLPKRFQSEANHYFNNVKSYWYVLMNVLEDWAVELSELAEKDHKLCSAIEDVMEEITWANDNMNEQQKIALFKKILIKCEKVNKILSTKRHS